MAGLKALNPATGDFTTYTTEDGLPSNLGQWTLEDSQGDLWIGTANGLVKFNPQTNVFRNYDVADGLTGIELSNDMFKSSWGEIFFVSINEGVNAFYPDKIKDNSFVPPVGSSALNRGGKRVVKKTHFWLNLDRINTIYRILFNINPRNLVNLAVGLVYFTV